MEVPLVSIIVPVYNAAAYLERCLASIQNQSMGNLEVILVNDGSTDNSLEICTKKAEQDKRFYVIDQANQGVSEARNAALGRATGRYVQFVDADDYLPLNATETLLRTAKATGADLTIGHFYRVIGDKMAQKGDIKERRVLTRRDFSEEMMKAPANFYYGVLWNKLYRRRMVESQGLRFERGLNWCEDFLFNLEFIRYARLIAAVPEPIYYYIKHPNSLANSQTGWVNAVRMKRVTFEYYKELYQALDLYERQKLRIYSYFLAAARDGSAMNFSRPQRRQKAQEKEAAHLR